MPRKRPATKANRRPRPTRTRAAVARAAQKARAVAKKKLVVTTHTVRTVEQFDGPRGLGGLGARSEKRYWVCVRPQRGRARGRTVTVPVSVAPKDSACVPVHAPNAAVARRRGLAGLFGRYGRRA